MSIENKVSSLAESIDASRPIGQVLAGANSGAVSSSAPVEEWGSWGHDSLMRIPVAVKIVLGTARMPIAKLMSMTRGAIIPLNRKVGDPVDILVNERLVARGEVVVLDENGDRFGIVVREVVRAVDAGEV